MGYIFVSYHRPDASKARRIVSGLTAAGYEVWWDQNLPAHRTYHEVIDERLKGSQAVVVLWSKLAGQSDWVRAEADMARTLGKLVQASADAELPPMPFNQIQCARLQDWNGSADHPDWIKVLDGVRVVSGPAGERDSTRTSAAPPRRWLTPTNAALTFSLMLIAGGLYWNNARVPAVVPQNVATEPSAERVAVLEFAAPAEPSLEAFVRGLADRIVDSMSTNGLQAIPNANGNDFRNASLTAAASRIGASFVLDGSVRDEADSLRVNAHIIDAGTNVRLWSNEFRRASNESAALEEQVATHVVDVLRCALVSRRPNAGAIDPQTLAIFMRACDVAQRFDGAPEEIYESARQVTVRAPEFSRGWSMLAIASAFASRNVSPERRKSLLVQARAAAEKARALDPTNAESELALSLVLPQRDWRARQALVQRAMEIDPNSSEVNLVQGTLLAEVGRMSEALAFFRRAVALDPLSPINASALIPALAATGNLIEGREAAERMQRLWPDSPSIWFNRFNRAVASGRAEVALAMLDAVDSAPTTMEAPMRAAWRQFLVALRDGNKDTLHAAIENIALLARNGQFDMSRAISQSSQVGEVDIAYALADAYFGPAVDPVFAEPISGASRYSLFLPPGEALRRDVRFMGLMKRRGLVAYWKETGKWPDFCADPSLPYDCQAEGMK